MGKTTLVCKEETTFHSVEKKIVNTVIKDIHIIELASAVNVFDREYS